VALGAYFGFGDGEEGAGLELGGGVGSGRGVAVSESLEMALGLGEDVCFPGVGLAELLFCGVPFGVVFSERELLFSSRPLDDLPLFGFATCANMGMAMNEPATMSAREQLERSNMD
jgi:hypothetical protein